MKFLVRVRGRGKIKLQKQGNLLSSLPQRDLGIEDERVDHDAMPCIFLKTDFCSIAHKTTCKTRDIKETLKEQPSNGKDNGAITQKYICILIHLDVTVEIQNDQHCSPQKTSIVASLRGLYSSEISYIHPSCQYFQDIELLFSVLLYSEY